METLFDDGKDAGALRTIGEVSEALGIKTHVLRYWEQQFPMLEPLKRSGGRRYYRPDDVALVQRIDRLVNSEGYTLKGARAALAAAPAPASPGSVGDPGPADGQTIELDPAILSGLKAVRARLAEALTN